MVKWVMIPAALIALSSCTSVSSLLPEPQVVVQTEYIERNIPVQQRPSPVDMPNVDWYVVNADNLDEFISRIQSDVGEVVFVAITPKGYENLALGISELRRYILQQQEIIVYYEQQVQPQESVEPSS